MERDDYLEDIQIRILRVTEDLRAIHDRAHHFCAMARSVNFAVEHAPEVTAQAV